MLLAGEEDLTAFRLPPSTGRRFRSTEPAGTVNREIKRRIDVVQVFLRRRAGPAVPRLLFEMHDEWIAFPRPTSRRQHGRDLPRKRPGAAQHSEHARQDPQHHSKGHDHRDESRRLYRTRTARGHAPHPGVLALARRRRVNVPLGTHYATAVLPGRRPRWAASPVRRVRTSDNVLSAQVDISRLALGVVGHRTGDIRIDHSTALPSLGIREDGLPMHLEPPTDHDSICHRVRPGPRIRSHGGGRVEALYHRTPVGATFAGAFHGISPSVNGRPAPERSRRIARRQSAREAPAPGLELSAYAREKPQHMSPVRGRHWQTATSAPGKPSRQPRQEPPCQRYG